MKTFEQIKMPHSGGTEPHKQTLLVRDSGPIRKARVRIRPLTLLIGDSPGKSHLAGLLKNNNGSGLVIEDPEAHQHPKRQRELAVEMARLIRGGAWIVVTTHGDLFCQQLNNLIKFGSLPEPKRRDLQKKVGLQETDYLLPEEVGGYELVPSKDQSHIVVRALTMTRYGLVMPNFNAEIDRLEAQTDVLDRAVDYQSRRPRST